MPFIINNFLNLPIYSHSTHAYIKPSNSILYSPQINCVKIHKFQNSSFLFGRFLDLYVTPLFCKPNSTYLCFKVYSKHKIVVHAYTKHTKRRPIFNLFFFFNLFLVYVYYARRKVLNSFFQWCLLLYMNVQIGLYRETCITNT